jgi:putative ABC transport system permease protein
VGTTEQFLITKGVAIAEGRFLSPAEAEGGRPVCVLGSGVATNLFQNEIPVGKKVRLGPGAYEVVGVLEKQGSFFGEFSTDNQVIIPVKEFMASFREDPDFQIQVKVTSLAQLEEAKEELRGILRKVRRVPPDADDDFTIDQRRCSSAFAACVIMGSISCLCRPLLFVGGIGIMNIMFVSVAERTREIGIRKAIGAKRRTILIQFLIEAASICVLSGLLALAIAYPLTLLIAKFLPATMSLTVVGIALLVSLFTGVLSGFRLTAWRAARMVRRCHSGMNRANQL